MAHNGGRSQTNFWFLNTSGTFPFINHLKTSAGWTNNDIVQSPDTLDANGYPLTLTGGVAYYTLCDLPTASEYSGVWILDWLGTGTLDIPFDVTPTASPGSLSGTDGQYTFTNNATSVGSGNNFKLSISATSAVDHIRRLRVYRADHATNLAAGEVWNPVFVNKLIAAKIGCLRFMDWQESNQSNIVYWADQKPVDYITYYAGYYKSSIWGGLTGGIDRAYTCSAPSGFTLVDKAQVMARFNRTAIDDFGYTLQVGATAAKRLTAAFGPVNSSRDFFSKPLDTCLALFTYDALLDCWCMTGGGNTNPGIQAGPPVTLYVDLCNRVGAHPWLCFPMYALEARTDYITQTATYFRDNLASGLIPRYEPSNEVWNFNTSVTAYGRNIAFALWGETNDEDNWYGKVASTSGQDVSAVYSADRTRYQMVFGVHQAITSLGDRLAATKYVSISGGQPASSWVTHLAMTTYWYTTNSPAQNIAAGDAYVAAVGAPAKLAVATAYINTCYANAGAVPSESIAYLNGLMTTWAATCATYNLVLTFYEGGFGTDAYEGGNGSNHNILHTASKDVAELYNQVMLVYNNALSHAGIFPSNYLMAGTSGYSALTPDIYDTSPSWNAISDFNNAGAPATPNRFIAFSM